MVGGVAFVSPGGTCHWLDRFRISAFQFQDKFLEGFETTLRMNGLLAVERDRSFLLGIEIVWTNLDMVFGRLGVTNALLIEPSLYLVEVRAFKF